MADPVSSVTLDKAIEVALNGLSARQRAISNNLANIDTPEFKASDVRFEEQLRSAMARDRREPSVRLISHHPRHFGEETDDIEEIRPTVLRMDNTTMRVDGNNVDIDREMVRLAETAITYNALVQLTSSRLSLARYLVNEGRR